jgi:hypothetical protein
MFKTYGTLFIDYVSYNLLLLVVMMVVVVVVVVVAISTVVQW